MTNHFANSADNALPKAFINKKEIPDYYWTIWHIGAGVGLLGGMFILACAVFLSIFQFLYSEIPHGSWLYAVVLPLWILGAHCFDKIEDLDKARRIEYCKKYRMTDEECEKHKFTEENLV
ncbi:MAG: hypothetical protein M3388_15655 [Acidobacteriota bacterium]|nr:hypothetical protein [Acidobacteriota bacterium]